VTVWWREQRCAASTAAHTRFTLGGGQFAEIRGAGDRMDCFSRSAGLGQRATEQVWRIDVELLKLANLALSFLLEWCALAAFVLNAGHRLT
jgi:hypothetical protein